MNARDVAKGLTPAMRRAVLWCAGDGSWRDHRRVLEEMNDGADHGR